MFNKSYGYGIYKRSQVSIGAPYEIKRPELKQAAEPDDSAGHEEMESSTDQDLVISQDIVHKAKEEAALIKREAELEAERILREAFEKAEQTVAEAEQKAKEEGYRKGERLAQQHYNDLIAEAEDFNERSRQAFEETLASLEQDIVELVVDIAAKVIGDEIRDNHESILRLVRETINTCSNREHIIIKVAAEDYEYVSANEETLRQMIKDLNEIEIRKDGTLSKGSCIIETDFGSVDGSIDTRINKIKEAFFRLLGDHGK